MARRAPRSEAVTVAELLVRSAAAHDRHRTAGTPARHREKPQVLRSLARLRVFSVVAGALALTGGVATAVSMPVERGAGAVWPPAGLEPPAAALVPFSADVVVPPAKPAPESAPAPVDPGGIVPAAVHQESNSGLTPAHRGKLAKAVKIVGKGVGTAVGKTAGKGKSPHPPKQAAPVRHEIPDVPIWSRGRPGGPPDWQAMSGGHRPADGHHCGGGGRHRR
ncbi:hypothetical protein QRX60_21190 [Amycolatopsis mongoliensis]|uniref:Uncharacterized protein n=1 Tax=Amycolatopsis mongoliensis TaxID=715475 RepID=A0A9Y2JZ11_9PSEU|nr:hypothetical protein [Amycolatopsis sp. 4-36]WIY06231.1 hypothetical protein QRX60_21190 [Amycolatopsis sp. 4-36]